MQGESGEIITLMWVNITFTHQYTYWKSNSLTDLPSLTFKGTYTILQKEKERDRRRHSKFTFYIAKMITKLIYISTQEILAHFIQA